jgi:hypothetical protein
MTTTSSPGGAGVPAAVPDHPGRCSAMDELHAACEELGPHWPGAEVVDIVVALLERHGYVILDADE